MFPQTRFSNEPQLGIYMAQIQSVTSLNQLNSTSKTSLYNLNRHSPYQHSIQQLLLEAKERSYELSELAYF